MLESVDCKHYSKYKVCMHPDVSKDKYGFNPYCLLVEIGSVDVRLVGVCRLKEKKDGE